MRKVSLSVIMIAMLVVTLFSSFILTGNQFHQKLLNLIQVILPG